MGEFLVMTFLVVVSACALVMTVTIVIAAKDLRRTMRRMNTLLTQCDHTIQDARRTLGKAHEVVARTNQAARHIEGVIHKACEAASEAIERVTVFKERTEEWWTERFGNGARSGPRHGHKR